MVDVAGIHTGRNSNRSGAGTTAIFKTLPYTGTKTSPEFYSDDYEGGLFFSNNTPERGYTLPCATYVAPVVPNALNNPKDNAGHYIVKWDCATSAFADTNDFEADETFTFAVDVTGTPWENWLKETPTAEGATRALAINKWTNWGDVSGGTNRLQEIAPNIFGATWNITQMATAEELKAKSVTVDSVVFIYGQVFGFEFTETNPGANWWMWPEAIPGGTQIDPAEPVLYSKPFPIQVQKPVLNSIVMSMLADCFCQITHRKKDTQCPVRS